MERIQSELKSVASQITPRADALPAIRRRVTRRKRARVGAVISGLVLAAAGSAAVTLVSASDPLPQVAASTSRVQIFGHVIAAKGDATDHLWMLSCRQGCSGSNPRDQLVSVSSSSVPRVEARVNLAGASDLLVTDSGVWTISLWGSTLSHFAPDGSALSVTTLVLPEPFGGAQPTAFAPNSLALAGGFVWVSSARGELAKVDASTGKVLSYMPLPLMETGNLLGAFGALWSGEQVDGVFELDPTTGVVVDKIPIADAAGNALDVTGVESDGTTLWVVGVWTITKDGETGLSDSWAVAPIDPVTLEVGTPVAVAPGSILVAGTGALAVVQPNHQIEMQLVGSRLVRVNSRLDVVGVAGSRLWGVDVSGVLTEIS